MRYRRQRKPLDGLVPSDLSERGPVRRDLFPLLTICRLAKGLPPLSRSQFCWRCVRRRRAPHFRRSGRPLSLRGFPIPSLLAYCEPPRTDSQKKCPKRVSIDPPEQLAQWWDRSVENPISGYFGPEWRSQPPFPLRSGQRQLIRKSVNPDAG